MSEGGFLLWKIQNKLKHSRGPVGDYSNLKSPLPLPPSGMVWKEDESTREWSLTKQDNNETLHVEGATKWIEENVSLRSTTAPAADDATFGNEQSETPTFSGKSDDAEEHGEEVLVDVTNVSITNNSSACQEDDEWSLLSRVSKPLIVSLPSSPTSVTTPTLPQTNLQPLLHTSSFLSGLTNFTIPTAAVERTASFSTLASEDGLSGNDRNVTCMIPGVDYVEHVLLPTDTLQGLCLAYKISATKLRQMNHFSGSTLLLAPKKLIIPLGHRNNGANTKTIRVQDRNSQEFKIHGFLAEKGLQSLRPCEAKAYLDLNDWDLDSAISAAREDIEWEQSQLEDIKYNAFDNLKENTNIRFGVTLRVHQGIPLNTTSSLSSDCDIEKWEEMTVGSAKSKGSFKTNPKLVTAPIYEGVPSFFMKANNVDISAASDVRNTIRLEDFYKAPPVDFGVEMQDLTKPILSSSDCCNSQDAPNTLKDRNNSYAYSSSSSFLRLA